MTFIVIECESVKGEIYKQLINLNYVVDITLDNDFSTATLTDINSGRYYINRPEVEKLMSIMKHTGLITALDFPLTNYKKAKATINHNEGNQKIY